MGHAHDAKIREKVRSEAASIGARMIFELRHHDIFEFPELKLMEGFAKWAKTVKHVKEVDVGMDIGIDGSEKPNLRIAVKYER